MMPYHAGAEVSAFEYTLVYYITDYPERNDAAMLAKRQGAFSVVEAVLIAPLCLYLSLALSFYIFIIQRFLYVSLTFMLGIGSI